MNLLVLKNKICDFYTGIFDEEKLLILLIIESFSESCNNNDNFDNLIEITMISIKLIF